MRVVASFCWLVTVIIGCGGEGEDQDLGDCSDLDISWNSGELTGGDSDCGLINLSARVIGEGEWSVSFNETDRGSWQPVVTSLGGGAFEGLVLAGEWGLRGDTDVVLWKQGYQSWSWSGITRPSEAILDAYGLVEPKGDASSVALENNNTSWWAGLVGRPDGVSLLLGAESANFTPFFMGLNGDELQAVWGHRGDSVEVVDGETLQLDALWVGMDTEAQVLWERYGDAAAKLSTPRGLDSSPPTGWATWYQYYSDVSEADVRENLEALIDLQGDSSLAQVDVFQIDDGWQERWGDWWAGSDFPSGMSALANDIAAAGMTPGLWMAPFYMSMDSETYTDNPDWWVLDEAGEPIYFSNLGTGDYVILDVTHPDAAGWLGALIEEKVAQGYGYLKLDFLYAGAMPGQRYSDVTGMEAYHIGMSIMREAAGSAWILACGAPLLPSLGYAESFRTGADIAFESSPDPDISYYRWQARTTAARSWTQGRWWWMDPDQLIIRDPLSEPEVRGAIASALVAGGTWMLGDDLVGLSEERLSLALEPTITSLLGQQATIDAPLKWVSGVDAGPIIEDLFPDDAVPTSWSLEDGTVVLINLGSETVQVEGPGGTNLFTGEEANQGPRTIPSGDAEIWIPE